MSDSKHTRADRAWLSAPILIGTFLVTRVLTFLMWQSDRAEFVANDVSYYGHHLWQLEQGTPDVMMEYPPPAVWILHAIYRIGGGWETWFPFYAGFFLILDAAVALSLYRERRWQGALFWILFTGANGAIVWFRFDLLPSALVAWACLWIVSRPRLAGAMIGLGAAIKLWPALLIAPMLAPDPRRSPGLQRLLGFLVVGGGLGIVSVLIEGLGRNLGPLTWQGDRGLQIESVPATWIMFVRTFTESPHWHIELSEFNALELFGPGVEATLTVASVLNVVWFGLTAWLTFVLIRRKAGPDAILLAILAIVLTTIVVNKTLSPQYILWLGGPVAALLVRSGTGWLRRHLHVLAVSLVIIGALTQYTYPWGAYGIFALPLGSAPETSVLVLRNLAVVVLTGYAYWLTLRASRAPAEKDGPTDAPHGSETQRGIEELAKLSTSSRESAREPSHEGDVA